MTDNKVFAICYTQTNFNMRANVNVRLNIKSHCHSTEYSSVGKVTCEGQRDLAISSSEVIRLNAEVGHK